MTRPNHTKWIGCWDWTTPSGHLISQVEFVADLEVNDGDLSVGHVELDLWHPTTDALIEMPDFMRPHFDEWFTMPEAQAKAWEALNDAH